LSEDEEVDVKKLLRELIEEKQKLLKMIEEVEKRKKIKR
jgi:hypothetical protein